MAPHGVDARLFHVRGQLSYGILHAHRRAGRSDLDQRKYTNHADDCHDDDQFNHAHTAILSPDILFHKS
jgi:hypothetical protein